MLPVIEKTSFFIGLLLFSLLCSTGIPLAAQEPYIPDDLKPWAEWVTHEHKELFTCTPEYNSVKALHCDFPGRLHLQLDKNGGQFQQSWVIRKKRWIQLPGNNRFWPKNIRINNSLQIILTKNNLPFIELEPGEHTLTGSFSWTQLPEKITIPSHTALVQLVISGENITSLNLDSSGQLWLKHKKQKKEFQNRIKITSYRLIEDSIPALMHIHLSLDIAGIPRKINLGKIYQSESFIPLKLSGTIPARIEQNNDIHLQASPGKHTLSLTLRHKGPMTDLGFQQIRQTDWPAEEIWSFKAHPELRMVEIEGATNIDPLQTSMPPKWTTYPAFRMSKNTVLRFKELKRGDPQPAPDQLSLHKSIWLRFDGSGYTIQDIITGKKTNDWRLDVQPDINLGRVSIDNKEQLITKNETTGLAGVEVRNGRLHLIADAEFNNSSNTLPATGWNSSFQHAKGKLYLPPGWKLIHATGADSFSSTWLKKWTLLDIFLVLIFTISIAKLINPLAAGISLSTLIITYHDSFAPTYIWLFVLLGLALLKYLPEGRFKKSVHIYQIIMLIALTAMIIPYSIQTLRIGVYPQLERPWVSMGDHMVHKPEIPLPQEMKMDMLQETAGEILSSSKNMRQEGAGGKRSKALLTRPSAPQKQLYYAEEIMQDDPNALTQTGPGIPRWTPFQTATFNWSGPVDTDQSIRLYLLNPTANLILAFIRVAFTVTLALILAGLRFSKTRKIHFVRGSLLLLILLFIPYSTSGGTASAGNFPDQALLEELQERLTAHDTCFPNCANIQSCNLRVTKNQFSYDLTIHSDIKTVLPLPGHVEHLLPKQILLNKKNAQAIVKKGNWLMVEIPQGIHTVTATYSLQNKKSFQLLFPLKPHAVKIDTQEWTTDSIHEDGSFDNQLIFTRISSETSAANDIQEAGHLPPHLHIERNMTFGLKWSVHTIVTRQSPYGSAISLSIPLIPGESVATENIRVVNNNVKLQLGPNQNTAQWVSFMEPTDEIQLQHSITDSWTETWKVAASPIYHMEYDGIPVILHKIGEQWHPTWHPWPGESVILKFNKPKGIAGQTLTIEESKLTLRPGKSTTVATLTLQIKSSQGGQHSITLPEKSKLQEVKINNGLQPIRQKQDSVTLPVSPGTQTITLNWLEPRGITSLFRTSSVNLNHPGVNATAQVYLPRNSWPLFMGGNHLAGPAVLFWSVILVLLLLSFGLAQTKLTPLKFHHWFLLGLGLSMSNLFAGLLIIGWLFALAFRAKQTSSSSSLFNVIQIGLAILTAGALYALLNAISQGLLGHPDMNIVGNGSTAGLLKWYHDISDNMLPQAWVISIPMFIYRLAMLLWALWISFWLISTLKWGWHIFSSPQLWDNSAVLKKKKNIPDKQ